MPLYPQGITRDLILTVSGKTASLSEQCYIYRGDRGITLNISIQQYKYKFNKKTVNNVITSDIAYARALVHKPWLVKKLDEEPESSDHGHQYDKEGNYTGEYITTGGCFEVPIVHITNDTIEIPITADWVDELTEVGTYRLQIQLYGHKAEDHRITIPPVEFYVEEPMCDLQEDFSELDQTGFAAVDYVVLRSDGTAWSANFPDGNYNMLEWKTGEIITSNRLNKIENALKYTIETGLPSKSDKDHDHANTYNSQSYNTLQETFNAVSTDIDNSIQTLQTKINQDLTDIDNSIQTLQTKIGQDLTELGGTLRTEMATGDKNTLESAKEYTNTTIENGNFVSSLDCKYVKFVPEYPEELEEDVLYILVEKM